jgi:hypothetical protein
MLWELIQEFLFGLVFWTLFGIKVLKFFEIMLVVGLCLFFDSVYFFTEVYWLQRYSIRILLLEVKREISLKNIR